MSEDTGSTDSIYFVYIILYKNVKCFLLLLLLLPPDEVILCFVFVFFL